jgi:hypothetical protein
MLEPFDMLHSLLDRHGEKIGRFAAVMVGEEQGRGRWSFAKRGETVMQAFLCAALAQYAGPSQKMTRLKQVSDYANSIHFRSDGFR